MCLAKQWQYLGGPKVSQQASQLLVSLVSLGHLDSDLPPYLEQQSQHQVLALCRAQQWAHCPKHFLEWHSRV